MKQADEQREAFEAWAKDRHWRLDAFPGGSYVSKDTEAGWQGYRAALAAALPPAAVQPPEFQEVSWGVDAAMRPVKGLAVSDYAFRQWAKDVGITLAANEGTLTAGKQGGDGVGGDAPMVADLPGMARQGALQAVLDALEDSDIPAAVSIVKTLMDARTRGVKGAPAEAKPAPEALIAAASDGDITWTKAMSTAGCCRVCVDAQDCISNMQCKMSLEPLRMRAARGVGASLAPHLPKVMDEAVLERAKTLYAHSPRAYRGTRPLPWHEAPLATRQEFIEKAKTEAAAPGVTRLDSSTFAPHPPMDSEPTK